MSTHPTELPPELAAAVDQALAVEVAREARECVREDCWDATAHHARRGGGFLGWVLVGAVLAAAALVVRVVVDRAARLDGTIVVPVLVIAAVVLVIAAQAERLPR